MVDFLRFPLYIWSFRKSTCQYSDTLPVTYESVCLSQKFLRNLMKYQNISNSKVMKRTLLMIVIAMVGSLNAIAQETESVQIDSTEISIDSLVVKLNTLQRNYDYLHCNLELNKAQLELKNLSNSISISSNSLLISYYNTRFDIDLYTSYLELYKSNVQTLNSLKENIDATKLFVTTKVLTSNFTEEEIKLIASNFELIDKSISSVNSSLEYFKVVIEAYKTLR